MFSFIRELSKRLSAETPPWFRNIAWFFGVVAAAGSALMGAEELGQIALQENIFNIIKIITIASAAVAAVSITAKK